MPEPAGADGGMAGMGKILVVLAYPSSPPVDGIKRMFSWLITGCSSGFGRALATAALAAGNRVAVTARNPDDIADITAPHNPTTAMALPLDVTDLDQVKTAVEATSERFGSIDVLVNDAGISYFSGVEESDESDVRRLFEINFFGLMALTNAVLPHMRQQRAGTIVNMASVAGLNGFPSVGYYCASKFAVEGISEALAKEIQPFGIRVLLVEPSGFRTDWSRSSSAVKNPIAAYDATPLRAQVNASLTADTPQAGNPTKAAKAIIADVMRRGSNLHLPLGAGSYEATMAKLERLRTEYQSQENIARSTDDHDA